MNYYPRKTKIIATIGPSTYYEDTIMQLIETGVNLFRLNFSHGTHETHLRSINLIRQASQKLNIEVGIIADLQGPKIRFAELNGEVTVYKDDLLTITCNPDSTSNDKQKVLCTSYLNFAHDVKKNERILIDDGVIELIVVDIINDTDVLCRVIYGGVIKSRKGINLPDSYLSTPSYTEKDLLDLKFVAKQGIDFVALSFVRRKEDLIEFNKALTENSCNIPIIAKIEKPEAVKNIDEIIDNSYAIMIARGDLGVEIPADQVPFEQKRIVKICNTKGVPVIIATQMLESMINKAVPTRAEANDIANAVLDGADCLMLSGETAAGLYPIRAVATMSKIIGTVEEKFFKNNWIDKKNIDISPTSTADIVSQSAVQMAVELNAKFLSCVTLHGNTALRLSKYRPLSPILAITDNISTVRKLCLSWGINSIVVSPIYNNRESLDKIVQAIDDIQYSKKNDLVVFTAGLPNFTSDSTNTIRIIKIKKNSSASFM